MKQSRVLRLGIAVLIGMLAHVAPALAQTEGRFTGAVLDPSGSAVPGATIVVKNEKTGEERTVTSNAQGRYLVANLSPSTYTIKVTLQSFAPLEYKGMQLLAAQEFPIDLQLQTAGVSESVTVVAQSSSIELGSASIGVNVSEREIQSLPVNGRQMSQLMLQAPGSQNAGTGTWNDVRFSGRANQQNVIKFDGVEGSAIIDAAPGNLGGQIPSPFKLQASLENVQEFRVESNNYPAEFGAGTGGQVSVITKSAESWRGRPSVPATTARRAELLTHAKSRQRCIQELPKSKLAAPVRRIDRRSAGQGSRVPLRRYEGYRLDAGGTSWKPRRRHRWSRAVPAVRRPASSRAVRCCCPVHPPAGLDIYQLQDLEKVEENGSACGSTTA